MHIKKVIKKKLFTQIPTAKIKANKEKTGKKVYIFRITYHSE